MDHMVNNFKPPTDPLFTDNVRDVIELTTQQAADVIGISRPALIRIIERGDLSCERVGIHRKVMLRDVLRLRDARREAQYRALEETATSLDNEEDVATMLAETRAARLRAAEARRVRG